MSEDRKQWWVILGLTLVVAAMVAVAVFTPKHPAPVDDHKSRCRTLTLMVWPTRSAWFTIPRRRRRSVLNSLPNGSVTRQQARHRLPVLPKLYCFAMPLSRFSGHSSPSATKAVLVLAYPLVWLLQSNI